MLHECSILHRNLKVMIKRLKKHSHLLHKTGLWLSILCTIHCLAMPVILTALPFLGNTLINETTEHILIVASLIIAVFLLSKDYQVHQNRLPFILLFVSIVLNFVGVFLVNKSNETIFVVLGASCMSAAYLYNWWLHKKVCHSHSH